MGEKESAATGDKKKSALDSIEEALVGHDDAPSTNPDRDDPDRDDTDGPPVPGHRSP